MNTTANHATKIASRVQKLLALSKSSNVHEAALAAAHAQRLMEKYRLGLDDIEEIRDPDDWEVRFDDDPLDGGVRMANWKIELAIIIAEHNACRVIVLPDNQHSTIQLVGAPQETAVVKAMYQWLLREIRLLTHKCAGKGREAKESFRRGVLLAIDGALEKARKTVRRKGVGLMRAELGVLACRQRDMAAEEMADMLTDGEEEAVGGVEELDGEAFVNGMVLGQLIDVEGHKPQLENC